MYRSIVFGILLLCFHGSCSTQPETAQSVPDQVSELLRNRIEAAEIPNKISIGDELIYSSVMLPIFYERRVYQPGWINDDGLQPQVESFIKSILQADNEGLRTKDYHLDKIKTVLENIRENHKKNGSFNNRRLVDLELLLTDAFLIYGSHLLAGRINPQTIDSEWFANRRETDLAAILQDALETNQINEALNGLKPPQSGYARLRDAYVRYMEIAEKGNWPVIPEGPKLQQGNYDRRVTLLRDRLIATGDYTGDLSAAEEFFDDKLETAIRTFQKRHGLDEDGVLGVETLAALNVPVTHRINQIKVNLERWRWLPQDLGKRYILVNIANFELEVIEDNQLVLEMRVVVGKQYRRTPVFSDKMTYLVFCPYWHVPPNIAVQDKLPVIRTDSTYLFKQNMKVFQGWGADTQEINPGTINWSKLSASNFPYRLRQDPGPNNALGRIKFMFPNQFNVYLHDTPSRELFQKTTRTFSSGCIRIEKPVELAEYVLRGDPKWNPDKIRATINKWIEQTVSLPEPIPVHLLYWTAWANENGTIQFRNDIYGRDRLLQEALNEEPPGL
ncbi:L,D-transpeptidase family protein [candidate division KSB1 bacterium]|nr:L,D-transpeptidase family protein [candidate division KSB1 bacterium]